MKQLVKYLLLMIILVGMINASGQVNSFEFEKFKPNKDKEVHLIDGVFANNGDIVVAYYSWSPMKYAIVRYDSDGVLKEELSIQSVEHNGRTYKIRDVKAVGDGFIGYWLTIDKDATKTYGIYARISVEGGLAIKEVQEIPVINYVNKFWPICRTDYPWALGSGTRAGGARTTEDLIISNSGEYHLLAWFSDKNQYVKDTWDKFGVSVSVLDKDLNFLYKVEMPLAENDDESMVVQKMIMGDDGKVYMLYNYKAAPKYTVKHDYRLVRMDQDRIDTWQLIKGNEHQPSSMELLIQNDNTFYLASHNLKTGGEYDFHTAVYVFDPDRLDKDKFMTEQIKSADIEYFRREPVEHIWKVVDKDIRPYNEVGHQQNVGGLYSTDHGVILTEALFARWVTPHYGGSVYPTGIVWEHYAELQSYGPIRFSLLSDGKLTNDITELEQELWSPLAQRMTVEPWGNGFLVLYNNGIIPDRLKNKKKLHTNHFDIGKWQLSELKMAAVDGTGKLIREEVIIEEELNHFYIPSSFFFNKEQTKACFLTYVKTGKIKLTIIDLGEAP